MCSIEAAQNKAITSQCRRHYDADRSLRCAVFFGMELILLSNVFSEDALPSRQVATKYGSIVGKRLISEGDKQVDAFLGVPFAKPPIGELRFAVH
ncbi:unnamed protein product [Anisakis simplex]|uniref:COesterase domain-containing protein n=1 Tax=Anisakis simplex TaxID=6269 RepID=A0A0M3KJR5_ANISI|nr:unnamed protein product [Anisakis simplex]